MAPVALLMLFLLHLQSVLSRQTPSNHTTHTLLDEFAHRYWKNANWKGASTWTGDNASRLMIHYLALLRGDRHDQVNNIFVKVVSRSLNRQTILQYLTQGYDDFGWTVFCLLEILQYSYHYEERYPSSNIIHCLPIIRERVAFRIAFLHDAMEDSWSTDFCGGGAEWKVRARKISLWPSLDFRGVYKNSITNHLYNSNNAQIYNAYTGTPQPYEITEVSLHYLRMLWKLVRPALGWSRNRFQYLEFDDSNFIRRAIAGYEWMGQAQLLTNESLYIDGQRLRFVQDAPDEPLQWLCDASVNALFTYNQVAGIRALRYLSQATGNMDVIKEGHQTIQNVIDSTYSGKLGSNGILQDTCDSFGNCTQDMQIFKGLPFLDIKHYCESMKWATTKLQTIHYMHCSSYRSWINRNAAAAYATVDRLGKFGGYWGSNSTEGEDKPQIRSIETQVAGLSVLLTSLWFNEMFG